MSFDSLQTKSECRSMSSPGPNPHRLELGNKVCSTVFEGPRVAISCLTAADHRDFSLPLKLLKTRLTRKETLSAYQVSFDPEGVKP